MTINSIGKTIVTSLVSLWHWVRARLKPKSRRPQRILAIMESLALPALALWFGWYVDENDPLGVDADFPWVWLGPWLVAVRYSVGYSLLGFFVYLSIWFILSSFQIQSFPAQFFLGGALVSLILGEFGASYRTRMKLHNEVVADLTARLERSKRRLFILRESMTQLEQELADRPLTLRDALLSLREHFIQASTRDQSVDLPAPTAFLQLLSQCCRVIQAGIYKKENKTWQLIASLGQDLPTFSVDHPLIAHVLETGEAAHVAQAHLLQHELKEWIFASILNRNPQDEIDVLFVVHSMPFMAFEENNLRRLQVLCACYADFVRSERSATALRARWPESPVSLQHEWADLLTIYERSGFESHTAIWLVQQRITQECIKEFLLQQPPDTRHWVFHPIHDLTFIVVTIPITNSTDLAMYIQEMKKTFALILRQHGIDHGTPNLTILRMHHIDDYSKLRKIIIGQ